jgi:hypothetical protein
MPFRSSSPAASLGAMLGVDASELEPRADPAPPAGDLKGEIAAFTTFDACVESRARIDPLLGDALQAMGYETFLSDACHLLEAAKAGSARRCSAIDASILREHCEIVVSEIAGQPDGCPWTIAGRPREGRDPACLALALRDPRLCAGESGATPRATCEAIAAHDSRACGRLESRAAQTQCQRSAARWQTLIDPPHDAPAPFRATETLAFTHAGGNSTTANLDVDVQRGVVLIQALDGIRLVIGRPRDDAELMAPSLRHGATFSCDLFVPNGGSAASVTRADLRVPGHLPASMKSANGGVTAKVEKLDVTRAGKLELTLDGDLNDAAAAPAGNAGAGWHLHVEVRSFVRDVVRSADVFAPPSGAAAGGDARGERAREY